MKKRFVIVGFMAMFMIFFMVETASADMVNIYTGAVNDIRVEGVSNMPQDKPILLYEGTTYVPFRYMGGVLGKEVGWDPVSRTISYGGSVTPTAGGRGTVGVMKQERLQLHFNAVNDIVVDGISRMPGNQPVFIYDSTTYVPFRYLAEISDKYVKWEETTRTISFSSQPFPEEKQKPLGELSYYYREVYSLGHEVPQDVLAGVLPIPVGQIEYFYLGGETQLVTYDQKLGGDEFVIIPHYKDTTITAYQAELDYEGRIDMSKFDAQHTLATFRLEDFKALHVIMPISEGMPSTVFLVSAPAQGLSAVLNPSISGMDDSFVVDQGFEVIHFYS